MKQPKKIVVSPETVERMLNYHNFGYLSADGEVTAFTSGYVVILDRFYIPAGDDNSIPALQDKISAGLSYLALVGSAINLLHPYITLPFRWFRNTDPGIPAAFVLYLVRVTPSAAGAAILAKSLKRSFVYDVKNDCNITIAELEALDTRDIFVAVEA